MRCCPELLSLLPWLLVKLRCCDRQRHRVGRIPLRLVWTISTLSIRLTSANWERDASTCSRRYNNPRLSCSPGWPPPAVDVNTPEWDTLHPRAGQSPTRAEIQKPQNFDRKD